VCLVPAQARIIEQNDRIYLEKFCRDHGISKALICSDADWFRESRSYVKQRQVPEAFNINSYQGCPNSCGSCPEHQQHICLPVIEITGNCDLDCPICLKHRSNIPDMTLQQFEEVIDRLLKCEGRVDVINLSGGEPLLHPQLGDFLKLAKQKGVLQATVSTNGQVLLDNSDKRRMLKESGTLVALQYDGLSDSTYMALRGVRLLNRKQDLVRLLEKEDIPYSLVATINTGVNDSEITQLTDHFFESKALSLMFQPACYTGHAEDKDPTDRITIPDVVKLVEQSRFAKIGDFNPLPCSHYSCFALSYYIDNGLGGFISLKEFVGNERYLDLIANRALPGLDRDGFTIMKQRLYELWSAADSCNTDRTVLDRIKAVLREMDRDGFTPDRALSSGMKVMKAIFIHQFMDRHTFDFGRLIKCCNVYPQIDGRMVPICAQNNFHQISEA